MDHQRGRIVSHRATLSLVSAAVFSFCLCAVSGHGFDGNGADIIDCVGRCANSGSCISSDNRSVCVCEESFTGTFCQSPVERNVNPTDQQYTDGPSVRCTESSAAGLSYKSWTGVAGSLGFLVGTFFGAAVTTLYFKRGTKLTIHSSKPKSRAKLPYVFTNDSVDGVFQQISRDTLSRTPEAVSRTRLNSVTTTLSQVYRRLNRNSWTRSNSLQTSAGSKGNDGGTGALNVELADVEMAADSVDPLDQSPSSQKLIVSLPEHKADAVIAGPEMRERASIILSSADSHSNTANNCSSTYSHQASLSNDDTPTEKSMGHRVSMLPTTPFSPTAEEVEEEES